MPHIKDTDKIKALSKGPQTAGQLAYVFTVLMQDYMADGPNNFADYAELVGVVVLSLLEYWKRVISPYEDRKAAENGDVFA